MEAHAKQPKVEIALALAVQEYTRAISSHYNGLASWKSHPGTSAKVESTRLWLRGLLRATGRIAPRYDG